MYTKDELKIECGTETIALVFEKTDEPTTRIMIGVFHHPTKEEMSLVAYIIKCWNEHDKLAEALTKEHTLRLDLELQNDDLLDACKGLMEKADNGSADFDDPEPGSIYLKANAAIAKATA